MRFLCFVLAVSRVVERSGAMIWASSLFRSTGAVEMCGKTTHCQTRDFFFFFFCEYYILIYLLLGPLVIYFGIEQFNCNSHFFFFFFAIRLQNNKSSKITWHEIIYFLVCAVLLCPHTPHTIYIFYSCVDRTRICSTVFIDHVLWFISSF